MSIKRISDEECSSNGVFNINSNRLGSSGLVFIVGGSVDADVSESDVGLGGADNLDLTAGHCLAALDCELTSGPSW